VIADAESRDDVKRRCDVIVDAESRDDEQEESAFGNAKPMLPYSSMFILGSTNPLVLYCQRLIYDE